MQLEPQEAVLQYTQLIRKYGVNSHEVTNFHNIRRHLPGFLAAAARVRQEATIRAQEFALGEGI